MNTKWWTLLKKPGQKQQATVDLLWKDVMYTYRRGFDVEGICTVEWMCRMWHGMDVKFSLR